MTVDSGNQDIPFEVKVASRFKMDRMIGSGSFGEIYMARDIVEDRDVAVKFEQLKVKRPQVIEEAKLLRQLGNEHGFPKFIWYGKEDQYHIMVIEMLGPSLEDLFNYCGRKFSLKTVLLLADQLISRIQTLH